MEAYIESIIYKQDIEFELEIDITSYPSFYPERTVFNRSTGSLVSADPESGEPADYIVDKMTSPEFHSLTIAEYLALHARDKVLVHKVYQKCKDRDISDSDDEQIQEKIYNALNQPFKGNR